MLPLCADNSSLPTNGALYDVLLELYLWPFDFRAILAHPRLFRQLRALPGPGEENQMVRQNLAMAIFLLHPKVKNISYVVIYGPGDQVLVPVDFSNIGTRSILTKVNGGKCAKPSFAAKNLFFDCNISKSASFRIN